MELITKNLEKLKGKKVVVFATGATPGREEEIDVLPPLCRVNRKERGVVLIACIMNTYCTHYASCDILCLDYERKRVPACLTFKFAICPSISIEESSPWRKRNAAVLPRKPSSCWNGGCS